MQAPRSKASSSRQKEDPTSISLVPESGSVVFCLVMLPSDNHSWALFEHGLLDSEGTTQLITRNLTESSNSLHSPESVLEEPESSTPERGLESDIGQTANLSNGHGAQRL